MDFFGRHHELGLLDEMYASDRAMLAVIYGRRRVGKTSLLTHWMRTNPEANTFFWMVNEGTAIRQLESFSTDVSRFLGYSPEVPVDFGGWENALMALSDSASPEQRLVVFIDEFTYLLAADKSVAIKFQKAWDHILQQKNVMLVLCGSYMGMMTDLVLSQNGPLYGRAQHEMYMQPFSYGMTRAFFPKAKADLRVAYYAVWGGVAGYWRRLGGRNLRQDLENLMLTPSSAFHGEPKLLLIEHVQDAARYIEILRAISQGDRTIKEIAAATKMNRSSISPYLDTLRDIRFVERRTSVTARPNARKGRYYVIDPFFRFYYRFIEPRMQEIELGLPDQAYEIISKHLPEFIGMHTWEEICREWLIRAASHQRLDFLPGKVGSAWNADAQIDVAAINTDGRNFIAGECKWTRERCGVEVLDHLLTQMPKVLPNTGAWNVTLMGFARNGWTSEAVAYAETLIGMKSTTGSDWTIQDVLLLTLDEVEADLVAWTNDGLGTDDEISY